MDIVVSAFMISGVLFMLIASIGIIKLPDFYIRTSVVTKASTIGLGLMMIGVGLYFNTPTAMFKVIAILVFILVTSPIAAHVIAKAASQIRVAFWKKTELSDYVKADGTPGNPKTVKRRYGRKSKSK